MGRKIERRRVLRLDAMALVGVVALFSGVPLWNDLKNSRFLRDLLNLTPFSDVAVDTVLLPDGMVLSGLFRKDRCVFDSATGLVAYVTFENGHRIRFPVDTSVEDARGVVGNRPVSGRHERFGPWKIHYNGGLGLATHWEVYAPHIGPPNDCYQTNLFAEGEWTTTLDADEELRRANEGLQ